MVVQNVVARFLCLNQLDLISIARITMPAPKPLTRRELDRLARTVEAQTKRAFSSSRGWEFEKALGNGSFGLTVLLRDRDPLKLRRHRRVVLKRALRQNDGVEDFVAEMRALWVR